MTATLTPPPVAETSLGATDVPELPIWRLSVEQYHAMIENGILTTDDRIELLDGWLVSHMPKNPPHALVVGLLTDWLNSILPKGWHVRVQEPVTLPPGSEPEPDVAVVRGERRDYVARHPGPEDVALLVEVADSSLDRDRGRKLRIYTASGIREYWIVDLVSETIHVNRTPMRNKGRNEYEEQLVVSRGQALSAPKALAIEAAIPVSDLLP